MDLKARLKEIVSTTDSLLKNRLVRLTIQGIIILISIIYLVSNFNAARNILTGININYSLLIVSFLLSINAIFLGALAWGFTLLAVGQQLPWTENIHIHLSSNLAKYIPGYAWQLIGKAYLTRQADVPFSKVGLAMILELMQLVVIGLGLALICFPTDMIRVLNWPLNFANGIDIIQLAGVLIIVLLPFMLVYFLKKMPRITKITQNKPHTVRPLFSAFLAILVGWLISGISYWLLGMALYPLSLTDLPNFIFSLTASILIGLAIVIVPGSIGIRESIMVFLLTNLAIPSTIAVLIAVLSRVIITFSELLSYFLFQQAVFKRRNYKIDRQNNAK